MMNKLIIFTGAGLSAESGLSTFRDKNGLWKNHDIKQVCHYPTFIENKLNLSYRQNLFDFYNQLKIQMIEALPHSAHMQIAEWQKEFGKDRVKVITTNLDTLLEKADCQDVLHVHGIINKMHCVACQHQWWVDDTFIDQRCLRCNSRLTKPFVYFFREKVPAYTQLKSIFHPKRIHKEDIILWIGSSMEVIAPDWLFKRNTHRLHAQKILINLHSTEQDHLFNQVIHTTATNGIKEINSLIYQKMNQR